MTPRTDVARPWLRTLVGAAVASLLALVTAFLTARVLGPEGRGLMSAGLLVAGLSSGVAQFGIAGSLVYHRGAGARFVYRRMMLIAASVVAIVTVPLAYLGLRLLYPSHLEQHVGLIVGLSVATAVFLFSLTLTQANHDLRAFNVARVVPPLICALFLCTALVADVAIRYVHVLAVVLFATAAVGVVCTVLLYQQFGRDALSEPPAWRHFSRVLGYAWKHHGVALAGLVLVNIDKIYLLALGDAASFGIYTLAFAVTRPLGAVQEAAATATFARYAGRPKSELSEAVALSYRASFLPMLVVAALVALFAPLLVPFLFGPRFEPMVIPFVLLAFEAVIGGASWTLAQRFNADGRPGIVLIRQLFVAVPVLALLPFLPRENTGSYLAGLLLLGAACRLGVTLAMFPLVLKQRVPSSLVTLPELRGHMMAFFRGGWDQRRDRADT